jgi:hypothetical protein
MKTKSIAFRAGLCGTVLLGTAQGSWSLAVAQAVATARPDAGNLRQINLGLATGSATDLDGSTAVINVLESRQHRDLNGDGDTDDRVVFATRLTDRDRNSRFDFAE